MNKFHGFLTHTKNDLKRIVLLWLKGHLTALIFSAFCLLSGLSLVHASRTVSGFGQWYAVHIYPILPNTLGRILSPLPFSVAEMGLILLLLLIPGALIFLARSALNRSPAMGRRLSACILTALCLGSGMFLLLTLSCSINYNRDPFAQTAGLTLKASSRQELIRLCEILISDAAELSSQIQTDDQGVFQLSEQSSELGKSSIRSMQKLGTVYPELSGFYPNPKPIFLSRGMSHLNLTGIFSAFSIEANYNRDVPDYVIPYTICHELAHLKGFIKEDEAGFISYLACRNADSPELRYSGTLNALNYTLNAFYSDSTVEEYRAMYQRLPLQVQRDFQANREYWNSVSGTVSKIASAANDTYLKANAQEGGIKSYGRIVDLLLAYYSEETL